MCINCLDYRLSHDCHFDIDRDVSTAHCRSCTIVVVSDWCITSLAHGRWVRSKALLILSEEETVPSAVRFGGYRLSCCLTVGIHSSGISIPLSLLMLLG